MALLHRLPVEECLLLNPLQITPALLRWHHAAYLQKMIQHLGLAIRSHLCPFGQERLDLGRNCGSLAQQLAEFSIQLSDARAPLTALRQIGLMQLEDAPILCVAKFELLLQPGQLRLRLTHHGTTRRRAEIIEPRKCRSRQEHARCKYESGLFHSPRTALW